jgi:hypothetical protein
MKGVEINTTVIRGEEGALLKAYRDNMGDPYRSGITVWIAKDGKDNGSGVFLQDSEVDFLIAGLQAMRSKKR